MNAPMLGWRKKSSLVEPATAPRPPGEFQGAPWNAEPTDEWNRPRYWQDYYCKLLTEDDSWRRERVVYRYVDLLIRMLGQAGVLPLSSPQRLLDAGCGVALIPQVLAAWGFRVTAIDSCPNAVEVALQHSPSEEELARCVPIWDPCEEFPGARALVDDPVRSLQRLQKFYAPDGLVTHLVGDWFDSVLQPETFGVVYCRNSLRCSTKPYWRNSLRRFHELLSPAGVLLLENVNAIGVQDEVEELLIECGFVPHQAGTSRTAASKYVIGMWPTG